MRDAEAEFQKFKDDFKVFLENISILIQIDFKSMYSDVRGDALEKMEMKNLVKKENGILSYLMQEMKVFNVFFDKYKDVALWVRKLIKAASIILKSIGHFFNIPYLEIMNELLELSRVLV